MQKYTQLTYEQRYHVYLLNKQGYNQTFIAKSMGRNKSTISRELSSVFDISYADGAGICKVLRLSLCLARQSDRRFQR
jgi:hypothetical protein